MPKCIIHLLDFIETSLKNKNLVNVNLKGKGGYANEKQKLFSSNTGKYCGS
jgi:hypothetical protein